MYIYFKSFYIITPYKKVRKSRTAPRDISETHKNSLEEWGRLAHHGSSNPFIFMHPWTLAAEPHQHFPLFFDLASFPKELQRRTGGSHDEQKYVVPAQNRGKSCMLGNLTTRRISIYSCGLKRSVKRERKRGNNAAAGARLFREKSIVMHWEAYLEFLDLLCLPLHHVVRSFLERISTCALIFFVTLGTTTWMGLFEWK